MKPVGPEGLTAEEEAIIDLMAYIRETTGGSEPIFPRALDGNVRARPGYHMAWMVYHAITRKSAQKIVEVPR